MDDRLLKEMRRLMGNLTGLPFPEIQAAPILQVGNSQRRDVVLGVGRDGEIKEKYGSKFSLWLKGAGMDIPKDLGLLGQDGLGVVRCFREKLKTGVGGERPGHLPGTVCENGHGSEQQVVLGPTHSWRPGRNKLPFPSLGSC